MEVNKIYNVDCLDGMKELEDNSVDLIVTDPPYGYSFMGKDWDKAVPSVDIWKEALRVLKPGAFAFVMCAPRQDVSILQMSTLQQAGFRLDFSPMYWAYAEGFPKGGNIGKILDKRFGAKRRIIGRGIHYSEGRKPTSYLGTSTFKSSERMEKRDITIPSTPEAKNLDGSYAGFQPKPAVEVILIAMKPLSEKNYVEQALANEKGITWLDDCRVPFNGESEWVRDRRNDKSKLKDSIYQLGIKNELTQAPSTGRFPANLLVSQDILDDGKITVSLGGTGNMAKYMDESIRHGFDCNKNYVNYGDIGSFSRYFDIDKWFKEAIKRLPKNILDTYPFLIVPKASKAEKNKGCESFENKSHSDKHYASNRLSDPRMKRKQMRLPNKNNHPTVKPIKLMSYLITLGSRQGDIVLDPFIGSGTTAIAARILSRKFIGYEKEEKYHKIAEARIKPFMAQTKLGDGEFEQTTNCVSEM